MTIITHIDILKAVLKVIEGDPEKVNTLFIDDSNLVDNVRCCLPLNYAILHDNQLFFNRFLKLGANPETTDTQQYNALDIAILSKHNEMAIQLIGIMGVNYVNRRGHTPMYVALKVNNDEMIDYLIAESGRDLLYHVCYYEEVGKVAKLINNEQSADDENGHTLGESQENSQAHTDLSNHSGASVTGKQHKDKFSSDGKNLFKLTFKHPIIVTELERSSLIDSPLASLNDILEILKNVVKTIKSLIELTSKQINTIKEITAYYDLSVVKDIFKGPLASFETQNEEHNLDEVKATIYQKEDCQQIDESYLVVEKPYFTESLGFANEILIEKLNFVGEIF